MGGKSSGSSTYIPTLSKAQDAAINAQTGFLTGFDPLTGQRVGNGMGVIPAYQEAIRGAVDMYNNNAAGVQAAGQNLGTMAQQAQETLGGTGESALRSGISGLQSLFDPNYEANQIRTAMAPAQEQYQNNMIQQRMQFGGTGNLGSARQALAGRNAARQNSAQMAGIAAQIQKDTAAQRMAAANSLAQLGQGGIGQALGAAGQQVMASMTPQDYYNKYVSVLYGTPAQSYNANFAGTQGGTTNSTKYDLSTKNLFG